MVSNVHPSTLYKQKTYKLVLNVDSGTVIGPSSTDAYTSTRKLFLVEVAPGAILTPVHDDLHFQADMQAFHAVILMCHDGTLLPHRASLISGSDLPNKLFHMRTYIKTRNRNPSFLSFILVNPLAHE